MSIAMRDAENLLNLLCREEENQLPVKEIPDSMLPDHQKILHELRDKLQSCYSISKTLKQRFQQQKLLIRKAQERIKNQIQELNECKEINAKESEVNKCKVDDLERSKKESNKVVLEQKRKLACLQVRLLLHIKSRIKYIFTINKKGATTIGSFVRGCRNTWSFICWNTWWRVNHVEEIFKM